VRCVEIHKIQQKLSATHNIHTRNKACDTVTPTANTTHQTSSPRRFGRAKRTTYADKQ